MDERTAVSSEEEDSIWTDQVDYNESSSPSSIDMEQQHSRLQPSAPPLRGPPALPIQHVRESTRLELAETALAFRTRSETAFNKRSSFSSFPSSLSSDPLKCPYDSDPDNAEEASYWRDVLATGISALGQPDSRPSARDVFDALNTFGTMIRCCPGALVGDTDSSSSHESPPPPRSCGLLVFGDGRGRSGEGNAVLGVGIMLNFSRALRLARLPDVAFSLLEGEVLMDIEYEPHRVLWEREKAMALLQQGKVQRATKILEKALDFEPRDLRALQLLGASLVIQGSVAEGMKEGSCRVAKHEFPLVLECIVGIDGVRCSRTGCLRVIMILVVCMAWKIDNCWRFGAQLFAKEICPLSQNFGMEKFISKWILQNLAVV